MVALFVVFSFIGFLIVDYFVLKAQGKKHPAFSSYKVFDKKSFYIPEDAYLTTGHTWFTKLADGNIKIGVDEFIEKSLSSFSLVPLVAEGATVKKGDYILEAKFNNSSVKFKSPIAGVIQTLNSNISNEITDPYGNDWALTVKPENLAETMGLAKTKEAAHKWLSNEFNRLKDFLDISINDVQLAGVTMHDGGNIVEGALANLNSEAIHKFEQDFLN